MSGDPITSLKEELANASAVLESLRQAIESSNQSTAAAHYQDLTSKLEKIQRKLENEFRWLAPASEEE